MAPLENPRVSRVPSPACVAELSIWLGIKKLHEPPGPAVEKCVCMCVCRLACGCHGNDTITSWVAKHWNRLSREGGESTSLENLGLFSPCKEKGGLQGGSYAFQGMITPHILSVLEATPWCACLALGPLPVSMLWESSPKPPTPWSDTPKAPILLQIRETLWYCKGLSPLCICLKNQWERHFLISTGLDMYVNMETDWNISVLLKNYFNIDGY